MENDTKTCSKCGVEKFLDEFPKRNDREIGIHPQCKDCRKRYIQSGTGITMDVANSMYKELDREQRQYVNGLSETLLHGIKAKHTKTPMGLPSARCLLFSLIDFVSKQEL